MTAQTIAIIDYGSGNLRSAAKAFSYALGTNGMEGKVIITDEPDDIARADKIVLPGQGAFGDCINGLKAREGMVDALTENVLQRGKPFFGICVGMQLLATRGLEFGEHQGLGWISGDVRKFKPNNLGLKIPHMGWNTMILNQENAHPMLRSVTKKHDGVTKDFYFVHSFVFDCIDGNDVAGFCDYGETFTAMVAKDNIVGTQFHPEKSQQAGLELITGFLNWSP